MEATREQSLKAYLEARITTLEGRPFKGKPEEKMNAMVRGVLIRELHQIQRILGWSETTT